MLLIRVGPIRAVAFHSILVQAAAYIIVAWEALIHQILPLDPYHVRLTR